MTLVALLFFAAAASATAEDLDKVVEAINAQGAVTATQAATVAAIARAVALPADALRSEQAHEALPWGDVFVAHRIATRGGHPLDKVFGARKTGVSWRVIVEDAKVDEAQVTQDLLAAFPKLAPPPPRPVAAPGKEPEKKAAEPAEKKPTRRFLDLFKGNATDKPPASDESIDSEKKRREEEQRDFMRGNRRY